MLRDDRSPPFGYPGFFPRDVERAVTEKCLMIDAEMGDAAYQWARDSIGRVEPPAEPYLDDAGVRRISGEGEKCSGGRRFEEAWADAVRIVEHLFEERREHLVVDELAGDPNPFIEAHEMRTRVDVRGHSGGLCRRSQECTDRAFAVGAGDVNDGRQIVLRITEAVEKRGYTFEPKRVTAGRKRRQTIELALDFGVGRAGMVH